MNNVKWQVERMQGRDEDCHDLREIYERKNEEIREEVDSSIKRTKLVMETLCTLAAVGAGTVLYAAAWLVLKIWGLC